MSVAALNELEAHERALRRDLEMGEGHALQPEMLPLMQKRSSNP